MKKARFYYTTPLVFFKGGILPFGAISLPEQKVTFSERHTMAAVYDDEAKTVSFGLATCSVEDRFQKSIGRELALKRAETNPFFVMKDVEKKDNPDKLFSEKVMEVFHRTEEQLVIKKYRKYFDSDRIISND